jgi:hypothetical protein
MQNDFTPDATSQESSNRSLDSHALHDVVQIYVPSTTIGASLKPAYTATCLLHEFAVRTQGGLEDLNDYSGNCAALDGLMQKANALTRTINTRPRRHFSCRLTDVLFRPPSLQALPLR